ncbi:hypothetical protein PCYB_005740, partial [Plasmodium cynomolgi strain B]
MSKNITDIENWKDDYPFLDAVWTTYNGFDKALVDDEDKNKYSVLCNQIINQSKGDLRIHTDICTKLMRNLGYFSIDSKVYQLTHERCNILFNWIYKSINEKKITDNIINKCFEMYDSQMSSMGNKIKCYFYSNIKIHEPINITLLDIFNDKLSTIITALMNKDTSISTKGRNFVCEYVKLYKRMNDKYCIDGRGINEEYSNTCLKLNQFKTSYMWTLYSKSDLSPIIPSLDNIDKDLLAKCRKHENILQLYSNTNETQLSYSGNSLSNVNEGQSNYLAEDTSITPRN